MSKLAGYRDARQLRVPRTVRAVTLSGVGFDHLACREIPLPEIGPDQLLCRVDAAGVCTSVLKLIDQGPAHTFLNGWDPARFPIVVGDEGSLTLVKAGANLAAKYQPGQRFGIQPAVDVSPINHRERYTNNAQGMTKCAVGYTLWGNMSQYMVVGEEVLKGQCLLPLPDENLPYFAVSMAEPISCVYSAQERQIHILKSSPFSPRVPKLGMLAGGTTVVIGAGPMGLMNAEMALRFKPKNLLVCDKIADRLERAQRTLGEKAGKAGVRLITVDPDQLKTTLHEVSGGAMADDIVLAVGIQPVQQQAIELLGKGGVANLFGGLPKGQHMLSVSGLAIHYDEIKLVGSSGGHPSDLAATLDAIARNEIDPGNYVFAIGGLEHGPEALRMIKENQVEGKVILYPHAKVDKLKLVDYWDKKLEEQFLAEHLES